MKRLLWWGLLSLVLTMTATRLYTRFREESADRRVTVLVDWAEFREFSLRQPVDESVQMQRLRSAGANALLVGASTVQDYLWQDFTFSNKVLAENVREQLEARGVSGVTLETKKGHYRLVNSSGSWERLKDLEVGFNPELLGKARQAGLQLVLRVNHDPWLAPDWLFADLEEIGNANQDLGIMLNTDEVPGGIEALPQWKEFLETHQYAHLLFEFRPPKSSAKLARRSPQTTFRAHTISPNEMKDLTPDQMQSRWFRAVRERSCRYLLVHLSPGTSFSGFLANVAALRSQLELGGWNVAWPKARVTWAAMSFLERRLAPVVALFLAIAFPVLALRLSLAQKPWTAYAQIFLFTLAGACVVAAAAQNPWTRLQIVPFRGIKLAFAAAWVGSFLTVYPWKDIQSQLSQAVRRLDVMVGLGVIAVVGYLMIRTGNAGSGWKAGWEQGVRDRLEFLLIARPRFKEFTLGYPLLLVGLHLRHSKPLGRWLIAIGMIGPISMINTFCHLHSPLYLAFWRSLNGFLFGTIIGLLLLAVIAKVPSPLRGRGWSRREAESGG